MSLAPLIALDKVLCPDSFWVETGCGLADHGYRPGMDRRSGVSAPSAHSLELGPRQSLVPADEAGGFGPLCGVGRPAGYCRTVLRGLRKTRNSLAHGETLLMPDVEIEFIIVRGLINQLF